MFDILQINRGQVQWVSPQRAARLSIPATSARAYTDAQIDNYHGRRRAQFPSVPPTRLALRARASHAAPAGTLGFGFWNDPFSLNGGVAAAPNAVWFFYASPPADMALVDGVPGWGWKAATLNAGRPHPLLLAPAALGAIALTRLPVIRRMVLNVARRAVQAREVMLNHIALTDWHEYVIDWRADGVTFSVDGAECLRSDAPPAPPLGLVIWIDNQYAIASREGHFGFGMCEVKEEQWLEVEGMELK